MTDEDVEVKVRGDAKAVAMFQHRVEKGFIVQDEIARLLITKQLDESFRRAGFRPENAQDEINVLSGELDPAVWPDNHHTTSVSFIGKPKIA
jgi:hypothetical protein